MRATTDLQAGHRPFGRVRPRLTTGGTRAEPGGILDAIVTRLVGRMRDARGQGLVEFALVLPLVVVFLLGIVQVGLDYSNYLQLTDAVRVGGRAGATQQADSANPSTQPAACSAAKAAAQQDLALQSPDKYTCVGTTIQGASSNDPAITITGTRAFTIKIPLLGIGIYSGNLVSSDTERLS